MSNLLKAVVASALVVTISGCASIAGDNSRAVKVNSYPQGAAIYIDNQRYGTTPAVVTLPSYIYGGKNVIVRKKGYQEQSMTVNTAFQPVSLINILCWPGFIIDAVTGSLVKIDSASRNLDYDLTKA